MTQPQYAPIDYSNEALYQRAHTLLTRLTGNPNAHFHPGQYEAIRALVQEHRRALVIQRTGWGKSAVYFISAMLLRAEGRGPALIISPLLALMRDQVAAAERMGVRAAMINSTNVIEWDEIRARLHAGQVDVLLISPERLTNAGFREQWMPILSRDLGMLVIDEAHCISDWGHDFRPDYRRISELLNQLAPSVPVLATTATANSRVSKDIMDQLAGANPGSVVQIRGPLTRDSLRLGVLTLPESSTSRLAWLARYLNTLPGSGIIYTLTVSAAEDIASALRAAGYEVLSYTGGTDPEERIIAEEALKANRVKALVATSALGMGFDKPDLGFVVHLGAPSSAISYYQQVGRAGRGAIQADVLLLPGEEDRSIWEYFATASMPDEEKSMQILQVLNAEPAGLSVPALEARVQVRRTQLNLLLKTLDVEGAVYKDGSVWKRTGAAWTYDAQRYAAVLQARKNEQDAMLVYEREQNLCRMVYLAHQLDDMSAVPCGRCDVCAGPWYPRELSAENIEQARGRLHSTGVEIEPRAQWVSQLAKVSVPMDLSTFGSVAPKGKIAENERAERGYALARLSDLSWGSQLRDIFSEDTEGNPVDSVVTRSLGEGCIEVLKNWQWGPAGRPAAVLALASPVRPQLVQSLARGIAHIGHLEYLGMTTLQDTPRFFGGNGVFRCADALACCALSDSVVQSLAVNPRPVLLVSEMVDSRWSFTVIARLLRRAGATAVYPFALAQKG